MAVRIQFRRGTAAEWASANPTLAAGELGYEVDTAQIKIGNAVDTWENLAYAAISASYVDDAIANVVGLAPETLDTLNELALAIGEDADFINTVNSSIASAEANALAYSDSIANSVTQSVNSYTDSAIANLVDSSPGTLDTLNELAAALGDDPNFATTITSSLASKIEFIADSEANFNSSNPTPILANTLYITTDTRRIKVGDGIGDWANAIFVGEDAVQGHNGEQENIHGISNTQNLVYQIDLIPIENNITNLENNVNNLDTTLNGSLVNLEGTINNINNTLTDSLVAVETSLGDLENTVNSISVSVASVDERVVTLEGTTSTQGGDITNLTSSVGALEGRADTLESTVSTLAPINDAQLNGPTLANAIFSGVASLDGTATLSGATDAELGYLSGVTSAIQTQLDDQQSDIDLKAPLESPTFGGSVVLPVTTTIGNVVGTEISSLENVSSNIQDQLNAKLGVISAESIYAPLSGPTFTGNVSLPSTTSIGSVSEAEIGHLSGVSLPIQSQIDLRAPIDNPTFTGSVSGITASMVGLTNVDNTSDIDKPVSIATQTALDFKLDLTGGNLTGKLTLDGDPTQALHAVTKQYVDSVEAGLITRPSVRAATTENLTGTYDNGTAGVGATLNLGQLASLYIDGITSWSLLDGILVKDQDNKFENGRYVVDQIGNDVDTDWILRRCSLCDTADEIPGSYIFVLDGITNEQTGWVQYVADPSTFTVGTDDIDVYQFAGAGAVTAGNNISVSGNEVSVISEPSFFNATVTNILTVGSGGMGSLIFPDGTGQASAGVPSLTQFTEKTANYTLDTQGHQDNVVEMNSSSPTTFTIPTNATLAWPVGASMDIFQMGTGQVTIANAVGVTLNFTPGNKLRTQFSSCTIMKRGTDSWVLYGDLTA